VTIPSLAERARTAPVLPPDLVALRDGDPDALAACYHAHAGRLLQVLERFTNSRADAEDVVHDVFVKLPELCRRYDERGHFSGWITRLAIRAALMRSRRDRRLLMLEEAHDPGVDDDVRDVVALRTAHDAVAALPEAMRHVLVLRVMLDLPHAEIAALLGISVGTSEVRLHRAIKQLRASVGGPHD
jgi:RNA polymerase sigma-70 factor (ECF subfamily)